MNVFIRPMVRIFSFGERWNVPLNEAKLIGTFHLLPNDNILTVALINIHYLYNSLARAWAACECSGVIFIIAFNPLDV